MDSAQVVSRFEAEALHLHAHAGLESSRGHDHERTIEAPQRLVAL